MPASTLITIGELSLRSGVAASALRFYEERGLISAQRTGGNQRRFGRGMLRRVSVIRAAQALGISLRDIHSALQSLPAQRTPNRKDWQRLSRQWQGELDRRIEDLQRLRRSLASCIGCGCLSLEDCALFNPQDRAARHGPGPRYLMGDKPEV